MHCSEARLAANRRNAARSTGPKTPEGKAVSRANGLKHGLCAVVCATEDDTLVEQRTRDFGLALGPQGEYQAWMVEQVAISSIRIDRCAKIERQAREKVALRAELTWDDDRRFEAEILGGLLNAKPSETVEALRRTPQGCEWLMTRWAMLAHAADLHPGHDWTDEQKALAFDLLATPSAFRAGRPGASIDFEGRVVDPGDDPASVARRMVAELKERREVVRGLDEVDRALALAEMAHDSDPELKRIRRYEATLHRRVRWAVGQVNPKGSKAKPSSSLPTRSFEDPEPAPTPIVVPESQAEVEMPAKVPDPLTKSYCRTYDEVLQRPFKAAIPVVVEDRREKKLQKAQARREAQLRKVEKRRA